MADNKKTPSEMDIIHFSSDLEIPEFNIKKNAEWYDWGKKNDFPKKVKDTKPGAPVHSQLIKRVAQIVKGKGFVETPENAAFIKNENGEEDLNRILTKCCIDTREIGGFFLNVVWKVNQTPNAIYHIPYKKVRVAVPGVGTHSELDYYFLMPDWSKRESENNPRKLVQGFSKKHRSVAGKEKSQIIYCKIDGDYDDPYSMPCWIDALPYIKTTQYLSKRYEKGQEKGTSLKTLIKVSGPAGGEEEKNSLKRKFQEFSGPEGSSMAIVYDADGISFETLPNESLQFTEWLERLCAQRISQGHGVPLAKSFGTDSENQKGTTFESSNRNEHEMIGIQNFFIAPIQQEIEYYFNRIFDVPMDIDPLKISEEMFSDLNNDNIVPGHNDPDGDPQLVPEKDKNNPQTPTE